MGVQVKDISFVMPRHEEQSFGTREIMSGYVDCQGDLQFYVNSDLFKGEAICLGVSSGVFNVTTGHHHNFNPKSQYKS